MVKGLFDTNILIDYLNGHQQAAFETNILSMYGERGKAWLHSLPQRVQRLSQRHHLSGLTPVGHMRYNYVLSGFQGQRPIILKLGPDAVAFRREAAALRAFAGYGAVELLAEDDASCFQNGGSADPLPSSMLLLERAIPGDSLKTFFPGRDDEAVRIVCKTITRLHHAPYPTTGDFPHIRDWLKALDGDWAIPDALLEKVRAMRDQLLATASTPVLLHGDLHHENILCHKEGQLVIDPKGVIGDATYESAAWIRNPMPDLLAGNDVTHRTQRRIRAFATLLGVPAERILHWSLVQAVLSWIWALEEGGDTAYFHSWTEQLDAIVRGGSA